MLVLKTEFSKSKVFSDSWDFRNRCPQDFYLNTFLIPEVCTLVFHCYFCKKLRFKPSLFDKLISWSYRPRVKINISKPKIFEFYTYNGKFLYWTILCPLIKSTFSWGQKRGLFLKMCLFGEMCLFWEVGDFLSKVYRIDSGIRIGLFVYKIL